MQEKYGFVYIWFDRKRKMYYIGMHWGTIDDGYICSSKRMRDAHYRRPNDFKRRILEFVYTDRKKLLEKEHYWLSFIKDEEINKKYYNASKIIKDNWLDEEANKTRKQRISEKTKEAMYRPEVREKYLKGLKNRDNGSSRPEVREKRRASMIGKNVGKDNSKAVKASADLRRGKNLTEEHKNKIKETGFFKTLNKLIVTCSVCGKEGNPGNIGRYHNEKCKY